MRDESIACLRTQPNCPPEVQRTSATLTESDLEPELMVCVHDRALKAEKEAARLRAALQTAQQEADMWRELLNSGPFINFLLHNHSVIYKIIIFFSRRSKRQRNFSLFYFASQES
jgi:hypothetical protein